MTIVTTHYRYKPPPKRKKPVALAGPAIVTIRDRRNVSSRDDTSSDVKPAAPPASDDRKPADQPSDEVRSDVRKPAIVTIRRKSRYSDVPELAPEEVRRRADAADQMF